MTDGKQYKRLEHGVILPDLSHFVCYNPVLMQTGRIRKRTAPEIAADIIALAQQQGLDSSPQKDGCNEWLAETGFASMEVEVESEQAISVEITDFPLPEQWDTHYLDIYEPSRIARIRVKNGAIRFSNKISLLPTELEKQKCCLRLEFKPTSPEGVLAMWRTALQFLDMPGCQVYEKTGLRIQLTDGTTTWLNFNGERYWVETDGSKPIEHLLPKGIEFRGYQKSHIALGPPPLYDKTTFTDTFWRNISNTSRTSKGGIDTSVSVEKANLLSSTEVKPDQVQEDMRRVANYIWETRTIEFTSPEHIHYLYSSLAALINGETTENPTQLRTWDVKYNDVKAEDLEARMDRFYSEVLDRYSRTVTGLLSPIELAMWIEYEFDHSIHPLVDGCGRVGKAIAAYFLARFNQVQPDYGNRDEYYNAMNSSYDAFKQYYLTAIRRGAAKLSLLR